MGAQAWAAHRVAARAHTVQGAHTWGAHTWGTHTRGAHTHVGHTHVGHTRRRGTHGDAAHTAARHTQQRGTHGWPANVWRHRTRLQDPLDCKVGGLVGVERPGLVHHTRAGLALDHLRVCAYVCDGGDNMCTRGRRGLRVIAAASKYEAGARCLQTARTQGIARCQTPSWDDSSALPSSCPPHPAFLARRKRPIPIHVPPPPRSPS